MTLNHARHKNQSASRFPAFKLSVKQENFCTMRKKKKAKLEKVEKFAFLLTFTVAS